MILAYLLFIKQDDVLMGQFFRALFYVYVQRDYDLNIYSMYNTEFLFIKSNIEDN